MIKLNFDGFFTNIKDVFLMTSVQYRASQHRTVSSNAINLDQISTMYWKLCSIATLLIIFFGNMKHAQSRTSVETAEVLTDAQDPIFLSDDFPVPLRMMKPKQNNLGESEMDSPACHIEYQITKKRIGRCIKLGQQGMTACVSGQYLNPLHPDCL